MTDTTTEKPIVLEEEENISSISELPENNPEIENQGSTLITKEELELERLEFERRSQAEEARAKARAKEFKEQKDFDKIKQSKVSKLEFLLKQTTTFSSFLENQLLATLRDEEPARKKQKRSHSSSESEQQPEQLSQSSLSATQEQVPATVSSTSTTTSASSSSSSSSTPAPSSSSTTTTTWREKSSTFPHPKILTGGNLRDYQLDGVQWLVSLYENGINGILGDEMGLGKTIQTIGFLSHLKENGVHGPFLIIGPLNTLENWVREFQKFAPTISVLLYHGTKQARETIRKKNWKKLNRQFADDFKMPIIITSYEIVLKDAAYLRRFEWKIIVVDEGHRLKNKDCILLRELMNYQSSNRLLLSGTPLQNSLKELWSLLHFLLPEIFDSVEDFESWFDFLEVENYSQTDDIIQKQMQENFISKLHAILKPFLLRRVKADVECSLPPKKEIIVYTHMTPIQKEYYTALLKERTDVENGKGAMKRLMEEKKLFRNSAKSSSMSLQAIVVQLRKCCNHPYLFGEQMNDDGEIETNEDIVQSCGKLMFLDRLLPKLKEGKHKVLLYSQMTQALDILEDYCLLRNYKYCRLDGAISQPERVEQMDIFSKNEDVFIFLLSTRAGGVGVNLIAADTVVFYDSDWNPHQDLQAQDRCHRIGQTRPVLVYRLITRPSIEERILARANDKRKLDRVVIQKGAYKGRASLGQETLITAEELKEILEEEVISSTKKILYHPIKEKELLEILDRTKMFSVGEGESYKVVPQMTMNIGQQQNYEAQAKQPK